MKKLLIIISLFFTFVVSANSNKNIESDALGYIDDICGDTWCEGDFDYSFDSLKCNFQKGICTLDFKFLYFDESLDTSSNNQYKLSMTFKRVCLLTGVDKKKMIDSNYGLINEFYDKVNDCISLEEDKVINLLSKIIL